MLDSIKHPEHNGEIKPSMRQPLAYLPVAMSLAALLMVLMHAAIIGVVQEADEGTAAPIFQFLLVAQIPLVVFIALRWLPRSPRPTLRVLALQIVAASAAVVAAHFLT